MNKKELINVIAAKAESSKADATKFLEAYQSVVTETLADGGTVSLTGFMTLDTTEVKERMGRNPKTGEDALIPAHKKVHVKIGSGLKGAVNG